MRHLYTLLFYLALPIIFLRLLWRSRNSAAYRKHWDERLGFSTLHFEKSIWIHAASVGETLASIPLVKKIKVFYPDIPIVFTTMTINGRIRAQAAFGDSVYSVYIPYDLPALAKRFLARINPVAAVIIETELWPNIFVECQKRHIPILVANARLSEKSALGYRRVYPVTKQMLDAVYALAVQTQVEADRFIALGLAAQKIHVTGSIKFDVNPPQDLAEKTVKLREFLGKDRLIWIAASTHATEEEIILTAHRKISEKLPGTLLILAPRHPERFAAVFALAKQSGFKTIQRSSQEPCTPDVEVYVSDTMGELMLMYSVCDIAFVAGSFAAIGGHNMLEAAVLGKPVLTGPQLFNFQEISENLLAAGGMQRVENGEELVPAILRLLQDKNERLKMGENAKQFVDANRGALEKHVQLIQAFIKV